MALSVKGFLPRDVRVERLRRSGALLHAAIFAVVIVGLAVIDWVTAEPYWVHWVFLGWGAGVLFHVWMSLRS